MIYINLTLSVISCFDGALYFCFRKFLKRTEYKELPMIKSDQSSYCQGKEDATSKALIFAGWH